MVVNGGMLLIQAPMYPVEYFEIIAGSRIVDANSLALLGFQRVMMRDLGRYFDAEAFCTDSKQRIRSD